jgi:hypothetical protein
LFKEKHVLLLQRSLHSKGDDVKDAVESGGSSEQACQLVTLPAHSSQLNAMVLGTTQQVSDRFERLCKQVEMSDNVALNQ